MDTLLFIKRNATQINAPPVIVNTSGARELKFRTFASISLYIAVPIQNEPINPSIKKKFIGNAKTKYATAKYTASGVKSANINNKSKMATPFKGFTDLNVRSKRFQFDPHGAMVASHHLGENKAILHAGQEAI